MKDLPSHSVRCPNCDHVWKLAGDLEVAFDELVGPLLDHLLREHRLNASTALETVAEVAHGLRNLVRSP